MSVNIDYLTHSYFYFDKPVDYILKNKFTIKIFPVFLIDSEIFLSSVGILKIDKNSSSDVKIIQMSYLQYIVDYLLEDEDNKQRLLNILILCLHQKDLKIFKDKNGKPFLANKDFSLIITHKDFEDIKKIILYQNLLNYDDEYINPELKKSMDEMDALKSKNIEIPSLERKIAIITSHTGLSKKEQLEMTLRSHELLFEEVCGEIDFTTIRPVALFGGKGEELGHWIFKTKKGKFDNYITDIEHYRKKMGGKNNVKESFDTSHGDKYEKQYKNYNK